jgi:hypothetical protein
MADLKNFVLDKLATAVAKQILHQLTADVVNWINSGFDGNPMFLTNPEGFFLDVADQVSGAYLATDGVLSTLCSPFNLEVRLALALNQASYNNKRYTCTVSKIIQNAKNARVGVGVTVGTSPTGATIGDILSGDVLTDPNALTINNSTMDELMRGHFQEGDWPAFVEFASNPINNPYSAYLQAQSDMEAEIARKKAAINSDLDRGRGFLSWKKCNDVTSEYTSGAFDPGELGLSVSQDAALKKTANTTINTGQTFYGEGTTIERKTDPKTNISTFQSCETQTPGSVIAGKLDKHVNSPEVQLELANDINAVLNALMTQMVSQIMSAGLGSLSKSSGGKSSLTSQILKDADNPDGATVTDIRERLRSQASTTAATLYAYKGNYDKAVSLLKSSKDLLESAQQCFSDKRKDVSDTGLTSYLNMKVSTIKNYIDFNDINKKISNMTKKQKDAADDMKELYKLESKNGNLLSTTTDTEIMDGSAALKKLIDLSRSYSDLITSNNTVKKTEESQDDLADTQTRTDKYNTDAYTYLDQCQKFPQMFTP